MTAPSQHKTFTPEVEAREWFVRLLDDDISHDDLVAWTHWIEADPRNRQNYESLAAIWDLAGAVQPVRPTPQELALDRYDPAISIKQWRTRQTARLRLVASIAAGLLIAAGVAGLVQLGSPPVTSQQLATGRGEHLESRLADGSAVRLGASTSVQVQFRRNARALSLPSGEALFKVAHDGSRPFVVTTPLASVTAVGTAFDLNVQADRVTLYVDEGMVDVDLGPATGARRRSARIAAGDRLDMSMRNGRLVAVQEAMAAAPTWQTGRLEYRDQTLVTILEDVNRYAPRPIILADSDLGELKFTGTVRLDATEAWAFGLAAAFPVKVSSRSDGLMLEKRHAAPRPRFIAQRSKASRDAPRS